MQCKNPVNNYCFPSQNELNCELSQYRRLWLSVIRTALEDANTTSKKKRKRYFKIKALEWLYNDESSFREVCSNAGLNADEVRKKIKLAIEAAKYWQENESALYEILTNRP